MDDLEDELMYREMMYEDIVQEREESCFAYPDPYEMDPADMMYLGEDGDILEDL